MIPGCPRLVQVTPRSKQQDLSLGGPRMEFETAGKMALNNEDGDYPRKMAI
jgi:hypothetical protein